MTDSLDDPSSSAASAPGLLDPRFEIDAHERLGQRCLRSVARFAAGEVLIRFRAGSTQTRPTRMTVQVSEREHIELSPAFLRFINHGCDPNVSFDVERWSLVALSPIAPRDELTFFYPSTEWTMASPFDCACQSARCLRKIAGASQAPARALTGHVLAPHIKRLLAGALP
jgi:SET domain